MPDSFGSVTITDTPIYTITIQEDVSANSVTIEDTSLPEEA